MNNLPPEILARVRARDEAWRRQHLLDEAKREYRKWEAEELTRKAAEQPKWKFREGL
jgi:hypothetical protein